MHIEMQDLSEHNWIYGADKSYYSNPADYMGFPNVEGISVIYNGNPEPPDPTPSSSSNKWGWFFNKKLNIIY